MLHRIKEQKEFLFGILALVVMALWLVGMILIYQMVMA